MSNAREGEYVAACPLIYVLASALFAAFAMTFKTFFDMLHFSLLTFSLAVLKGGSVALHCTDSRWSNTEGNYKLM